MTLLPEPKDDHRPYFHYIGSLTTPPCSEGIDWFVMAQTVKITDKQVRCRKRASGQTLLLLLIVKRCQYSKHHGLP